MRAIVVFLPLLFFVLTVSVLVFLIYALISIVKSNQSQAESLKAIERALKSLTEDKLE